MRDTLNRVSSTTRVEAKAGQGNRISLIHFLQGRRRRVAPLAASTDVWPRQAGDVALLRGVTEAEAGLAKVDPASAQSQRDVAAVLSSAVAASGSGGSKQCSVACRTIASTKRKFKTRDRGSGLVLVDEHALLGVVLAVELVP